MMLDKKRFLILLLCLVLLPLSSLAAQHITITELREQAAQGWHQTYEAHGRTISVDVQPHVPEVTAFPVLACVVAHQQPQPDPLGIYTIDDRQQEGILVLDANGEEVTGKRGYAQGWVRYSDFDFDTVPIPANQMTLRESIDLVRATLIRAGLDEAVMYLHHPYSVEGRFYQDKNGQRDEEPGLLGLNFHLALRGIPITGLWHKAFVNRQSFDHYVPIISGKSLIKSSQEYVVLFHGAMQETAVLAEDVPLAGFDQVKKSLEAEIEAGRLRHIFGITLGYTVFRDQNNAKKVWTPGNTFYALPYWTVDCIYVESAKKALRDYSDWEDSLIDPQNVLEYKRLLINAQTGQLMDPLGKPQNKDIYPGFLSWEEVKP